MSGAHAIPISSGSFFVVLCAILLFGCSRCDTSPLRSIEDREGDNAKVHNNPPVGPQVAPGPNLPLDPPADPTDYARAETPNPIPAENAKPGSSDWQSGVASWRDEIELYTSSESALAGEKISVKVTSNQKDSIRAQVFRIGWYGGAGAKQYWEEGPHEVSAQSECVRDVVTSRVECDWPDTFEVPVGKDWPSGFYIVKILRASDNHRRWVPFVVRDRRAAEILFTPNFSTYQAYNTFGGESLYADASGTMPSGRAWEVSFNRPYRSNEGGGKTFDLDVAMVQFLEKHGYDVTYGSQLDFVRHTGFLNGIGAFVHGGHDEYWPTEERTQVDEALASGQMSLAYFGGNGAYWRSRLSSDSKGNEVRTLICYKSEPDSDPVPHSTVRFRDEPNAAPEHALFGSMYDGWQLIPFSLVVTNPSHWTLEGTGLVAGEQLYGLVGYEFDKTFPEVSGHPADTEVVMQSPVVTAEGIPSYSTVVARFLPSGRLVFSASTIWWPRGLSSDPRYRDGRIERITLNVLERALEHRRPKRQLPVVTSERPTKFAPIPVWVSDVKEFVGAGSAGYVDGAAGEAKFDGPTGLAVTAEGELIVADTGNNRIRLLRKVGETWKVETIAGDGRLGYLDGEGASTMFRRPTDVVVAQDGSVFVADSDNHAIRRLEKGADGKWLVTTYAGKGHSRGFAEGSSTAARLNRPTAIDLDSEGNLYVADQANNRIRMVRKDTQEVVTVAGNGDTWGWRDAAVGTQAQMNNPSAIAVAPDGSVYFIDGGNQRLRRVNPDANRSVTTIAGDLVPNEPFGYRDGTGNEARFLAQMGLEISPNGDVLVSDTANFRIRKVVVGDTPATTQVYTIAGTGRVGGELGSGANADIVAPTGLVLGTNGKLYVSDSHHHLIRELTF